SNVAISPDGRYIVYALREGEKQGLNIRQVATGSDVQILPPEEVMIWGLTFSPDANYIDGGERSRQTTAGLTRALYGLPSARDGLAGKRLSDVSPCRFLSHAICDPQPQGACLLYTGLKHLFCQNSFCLTRLFGALPQCGQASGKNYAPCFI